MVKSRPNRDIKEILVETTIRRGKTRSPKSIVFARSVMGSCLTIAAMLSVLVASGSAQSESAGSFIGLARLLEIARAARASSHDSPSKAAQTFRAAVKQEGTLQGASLTTYLRALFEFTIAERKRPSVSVMSLQDRQIITLMTELQDLAPLTGRMQGMPQTTDVCLTVYAPDFVTAIDVQRVVLMRNGKAVPPTANTLSKETLTSGAGVSVLRHSGSICWPLGSFEPSSSSAKLILFLSEGDPYEVDVTKDYYDSLAGHPEARGRD